MFWLIVYNLLSPFLLLGFIIAGLLGKRRKTFLLELLSGEAWKERLGVLKKGTGPFRGLSPFSFLVWFHAASLGEVKCLESLLRKMGTVPIFLTTMTQAGKIWAQENYLKKGLVSSVALVPLDIWPCVWLYLRQMPNLKLLVLVETELWPNLIFLAKKRGIKLALINARLSTKSLRWLKLFSGFTKKLFSSFNVIAASSEENFKNFTGFFFDASRITHHASRPQVVLTGNLKWDFEPPQELLNPSKQREIRKQFGFKEDDFLFVAGSTHVGEEEILLEAFKNLSPKYPNLRLILAPRHLERVPKVRSLLPTTNNQSAKGEISPTKGGQPTTITIIDQFGVLTSLYAIADCVFIGGTLVPKVGGHNFLEPAAFAKPILMGPYFENFTEVGVLFKNQEALKILTNAPELEKELESLIQDRHKAVVLGQSAFKLSFSLRGASDKTSAILKI